jgi:leucyl aminopeptidase (aminopeptidase T)
LSVAVVNPGTYFIGWEEMMADVRIEKLADLLVNYSVEIKPGQQVLIRGISSAEPLIRAIYIKVLQAGGNPWLGISYPETGSVNQSAIHWDMLCDLRQGGQIWADDQLLYENGHFTLDL